MAILKDSILFNHVSGSLGDEITIYRRNNQVIVAKKRRRSTQKPTKKQLAARKRMEMAAAIARELIADPELKAYYKSKAGPGQNAFNMALQDAYHSPEIQHIKVEESTVVVTAKNQFRVAEVEVRVLDAAGVILEKGKAALGRNGVDWYYQFENLEEADRIVVVAVDIPGNETIKDLLLGG